MVGAVARARDDLRRYPIFASVARVHQEDCRFLAVKLFPGEPDSSRGGKHEGARRVAVGTPDWHRLREAATFVRGARVEQSLANAAVSEPRGVVGAVRRERETWASVQLCALPSNHSR